MGRNRQTTSHGKGFIRGFFFGSLLAGAAALLLAPKSGKETQGHIKETAKRVTKRSDGQLSQVESELGGRIDSLKQAARDLRGEAFEESQRLIARAELLRNDLVESTERLSKGSKDTKKTAGIDAKRLMGEGQAVIADLERMTRRIMRSAKDKAGEQASGDSKEK